MFPRGVASINLIFIDGTFFVHFPPIETLRCKQWPTTRSRPKLTVANQGSYQLRPVRQDFNSHNKSCDVTSTREGLDEVVGASLSACVLGFLCLNVLGCHTTYLGQEMPCVRNPLNISHSVQPRSGRNREVELGFHSWTDCLAAESFLNLTVGSLDSLSDFLSALYHVGTTQVKPT